MREVERDELRSPAVVLDIDVVRPEQAVIDVSRFASAWCLVRRDGVAVAARFLDLERVSELALSGLADHFAMLGPSAAPIRDLPSDDSLTVVICTRDRRESLTKLLNSLVVQSDPNFDVVVVDNSEIGDVADDPPQLPNLRVRYVHEPVAGLSRARNRGLAHVDTDLIAWIDDDETADRDWIAWLKRGFADPQCPDAVAGMMLPAELETNAQVDWERYGGFNKGRGMSPEFLKAGTPTVYDPLYPKPIFGSGGNMAFRTEKLRAIGGFENRLGAGTLTRGGEDTRALALMLEAGSIILHWPYAITWHYHRRTDDALEKQVFGNAAGLAAFYAHLILSEPRYLLRVLKFAPREVREMLRNRNEPPSDELPQHLLSASRRGLVQGPWLYIREALKQRRAAARAAIG